MESGRYYPNKSLAAHVLGGVDFEGKGNGGVEQFFNSRLKGHAGEMRLTRDVQKRGFASTVARDPQPGQDLKLTIDSRVALVRSMTSKPSERSSAPIATASRAALGSGEDNA